MSEIFLQQAKHCRTCHHSKTTDNSSKLTPSNPGAKKKQPMSKRHHCQRMCLCYCLPRCAGGGRKDEWAVGGEINWAEDGLTGPIGKD